MYKTAGFEFKTTKEYSVSVTTLNPNNNTVLGAYVELYTENPLDQSGRQINYSKLIFKGMTNQYGELDCKLSVATTADSLYVLTNYVGLPAYKSIALSSDEIHIVICGVYVEDLVEGMIRMMGTPDSIIGPINIGNPNEFTMLELATKVIDLTGSSSKLIFKDLPADDPKQRQPDIRKAKEILNNWEPNVQLTEGLKKTIAYFEEELR